MTPKLSKIDENKFGRLIRCLPEDSFWFLGATGWGFSWRYISSKRGINTVWMYSIASSWARLGTPMRDPFQDLIHGEQVICTPSSRRRAWIKSILLSLRGFSNSSPISAKLSEELNILYSLPKIRASLVILSCTPGMVSWNSRAIIS